MPRQSGNRVKSWCTIFVLFVGIICLCGNVQATESPLFSSTPLHERFSLLEAERLVLASGGSEETIPAVPTGIEMKSPTKAGLLGGLLGFGSGQYYAKAYYSGTFFLLLDGASLLFLGAGFGLANEFWDEGPAGKVSSFMLPGAMIATSGTILIVSHIVQAIWGPSKVRNYNEKQKSQQQVRWQPLLLPAKDGLAVGLTWHF